jgi:acyl-coenzyme A synthetase/AMP-(fatty) acid ligase
VEGFKVPRHVFFVGSYPMTASGKVQRVALRAHVLSLMEAGDLG